MSRHPFANDRRSITPPLPENQPYPPPQSFSTPLQSSNPYRSAETFSAPIVPTRFADQVDQVASQLGSTHLGVPASPFGPAGSNPDPGGPSTFGGRGGASNAYEGEDDEDEIGEGEDEAVHFVLLAEFDIDLGSTISQQYPYPTGTDEQ
jgi:hypothetical protein